MVEAAVCGRAVPGRDWAVHGRDVLVGRDRPFPSRVDGGSLTGEGRAEFMGTDLMARTQILSEPTRGGEETSVQIRVAPL
jgi:hypothetical protein